MKLLESESEVTLKRWRNIMQEVLDLERRMLVDMSCNPKTPIETIRWHGGRVAVLHDFTESINLVLQSKAKEKDK